MVSDKPVMDEYILSVDVGTTNIRSFIFNKQSEIIASSSTKTKLIYPENGRVEMCPKLLWDSFIEVCRSTLKELDENKRVKCLAIATLRNTFVLWDKETGVCYHNFIVWNDLRAFNSCTEWNGSLFIKLVNNVSKVLYFISRSKKFLATSMFKFNAAMVAMKLVWVLNNVPLVKERAMEGKVLYGTLDTWLAWKLTGGQVHATEPTNACGSGFYDTYQLKWSNLLLKFLDIPYSILPKLKNTNDFFGTTQSHHFGYSIPIHALVGDQSAATFGECCFNAGDVKITIGTGSFVNINTGSQPEPVLSGIYPMVGWKLKNGEVTFILEGSSHDSGAVINWAQSIDLFSKPDQTQSIAESVTDSNGLYFVPAFSGLQAPYNDPSALCSIIGINATTSKAHITRAILESLAFRILELIEVISTKVKFELKTLRVNGGVSENKFVMQLLSNLLNKNLERSENPEISALGAAFMAGLSANAWKDKQELERLRKISKVYKPNGEDKTKILASFEQWKLANLRCLNWSTFDCDKNLKPISVLSK